MGLSEILLFIGGWIIVIFGIYSQTYYLKKKKMFWVVKLQIVFGIIFIIIGLIMAFT